MLSYQHIYHAGNMADVHKHALLAWVLDYMGKKDKPMSYMETHSGRGLYQLDAAEARKTGEAAAGIAVVEKRGWFGADHPYARAIAAVRDEHGKMAYPGSPLIAAQCLRETDVMRLAELHPREFEALDEVMGWRATCINRNGVEVALSQTPPDPKRGVLLIDPSYEVKDEYQTVADLVRQVHRKWNVGVIMLWYPILTDGRHKPMVRALRAAVPDGIAHEVDFPPAREGHGMVGSGMFVVNAPFGFSDEAVRLTRLFASLPSKKA